MIAQRFSTRILLLSILATAHLGAQDAERELYEQRRAAQQERQQQKNDRNQEIREASSNLRQYATDLKNDYREQVRDLDTEFRLQQVDLKAEHQTRVAASERELQTKLSAMYMQLGNADEETAENLQAGLVEHMKQTFELRKQAAEAEHAAKVAIEESKIALLDERDENILAEADSLGLTQDYAPILAKPIGGELTDQEERWNERELKEVERLKQNDLRLLKEYRNGPELRRWELNNLKEDFKLEWEEKVELQGLESEMTFLNPMFSLAASNAEPIDQQAMMAKMAELQEKKQAINIKYNQIQSRKRIERGEERREILAK